MTELPDYWGTAEFEIYSISNLNDNTKPTVVALKLYGEIRGSYYSIETTLVAPSMILTYDLLAEHITYNCLYPWVESIISKQDAVDVVL